MKIEFVNHASYIVQTGEVRLIADPWIEGRAFNQGWDLLCETKFTYEDFKDITHIWFSHEHPDHFYPPNIKKIPEEYRREIIVLFQETADKKVVNFCKKMGFKDVVELVQDTPLEIVPDVKLMCNVWTHGDSYLYMEADGEKLLNLNDCIVLTEEDVISVGEKIGPVDLLLTQFSLSAWEGNPEDIERRKAGAKVMLDRIVRQTKAIKPKFVIPFASYVWFCHEENFYINAEGNRVELVESELKKLTDATPIIMAPGDEWVLGESLDNEPAIELYNQEYDSLENREKQKSEVIPFETLKESSEGFIAKLVAGSGSFRMRISFARLTYAKRKQRSPSIGNFLKLLFLDVEPAHVYLTDHEKAYDFSLVGGLEPSKRAKEDCDIALGSDSLNYAFKFLWGGESLLVNGRFSEIYPNGRFTLFDYFNVALAKNQGHITTWQSMPKNLFLRLIGKGKKDDMAEATPYDFLEN